MDMKRILQAMDGVATKPVAGASDMARFLRVVSESDINPTSLTPEQQQKLAPYLKTAPDGGKYYSPDINDTGEINNTMVGLEDDPATVAKMRSPESQAAIIQDLLTKTDPTHQIAPVTSQSTPVDVPADALQENNLRKFLSIVDKNNVSLLMEGSPHKVSLPVQMTMQHYQKVESQHARVGRESVVRKYFDQAEQAVQEEQIKKKNFYKQYAQTIADRVLMKENKLNELVNPFKVATDIVKSNPKKTTAGVIVGGNAAHLAIGNPDKGDWYEKRIFEDIPYNWMELALDLGMVGLGAAAGAMGGPAGEAAMLAANMPKLQRVAKIIQKALSIFGADVRQVGPKLVPKIREWARSYSATAGFTMAVHTLIDLLDDGLNALEERSTTEKQARTMAAAAHNPAFAKKAGIDQKVAKEFNQKDKGTALLSNAMKGKRKKVKELDGHSMGFDPGAGPGMQPVAELSTELLGRYKKAAHADAKKADAEGDYARGDKRFKGINKATIKQFDNDLKKHNQNPIKEANAKKRTLKNSNPCWNGYKPVGTKKKGGRTVPNCVPKD